MSDTIPATRRCTDHHVCRCARADELAAQDRLGEAIAVHTPVDVIVADHLGDPRVVGQTYEAVRCRMVTAEDANALFGVGSTLARLAQIEE